MKPRRPGATARRQGKVPASVRRAAAGQQAKITRRIRAANQKAAARGKSGSASDASGATEERE